MTQNNLTNHELEMLNSFDEISNDNQILFEYLFDNTHKEIIIMFSKIKGIQKINKDGQECITTIKNSSADILTEKISQYSLSYKLHKTLNKITVNYIR